MLTAPMHVPCWFGPHTFHTLQVEGNSVKIMNAFLHLPAYQAYDLVQSVIDLRRDATLQISMTRAGLPGLVNASLSARHLALQPRAAEIYGDPVFDVRKGSEDGRGFEL